jgi:hypothetical protein
MNALHPDLDLTKSHGRRQFGEITVFLTWTDLPQADGTKIKDAPVVVLAPTNLLGVRVIRPCVVPLKNAWAWAEETGVPGAGGQGGEGGVVVAFNLTAGTIARIVGAAGGAASGQTGGTGGQCHFALP